MDVVKGQAEKFFRRSLFGGGKHNDLDSLRKRVITELHNFNRQRDQVKYLQILRPLIVEDKLKHEQTCSKSNCGYSEERDIAVFVIDQEIEDIRGSNSYKSEYQSHKSFTPEEETVLLSRLNEIDEKLRNLGYGQEIIFEELEELKLHFSIGRKNWFQLVKGKLIDLGLEKTVEETIIKQTWDALKKGFESVPNLLD